MRLRSWLFLIPILLLAFWLGARSLDADSIWLDEYFSIFDAGVGPYGPLTPAEIWNRIGERNPWHAPGYFVLLSGWTRVVGAEPAALRALSLLFGVLAVAATFRLGKLLLSEREGLYAAALLASSSFFVYYEHEVRMYTIVAFMTTFAFIVYFKLMKTRQPHPRRLLWGGWFFCVVAILYIHYLAAIPLVALAVYHFVWVPKRRRWWQVGVVVLLAGLVFLPWAQTLLAGLGLASESDTLHDRALSTRRLAELTLTLLGNGSLILTGVLGVVAAIDRRRYARTIVFLFAAILGLFLVLNRAFEIIPSSRIRYLLSLWPLFALVGAIALTQLKRWRWAPVVALGLLTGAGVYEVANPGFAATLPNAGYLFPLHKVDDVMRGQGQADDAVVYVLPDTMAAITYSRQADFYAGYRHQTAAFVEPRADDPGRRLMLDGVISEVQAHERVWVALMPGLDATALPLFETFLDEHYVFCRVTAEEEDLWLALYAESPALCQ